MITNDLQRFGRKELDVAKELLSHVKELDSSGKVEVQFNTESGCVFLVDEDDNVWMMNGKSTEHQRGSMVGSQKTPRPRCEQFFHCSFCAHEGFKNDLKHCAESVECVDFMKEHGITADEFARGVNTFTPAVQNKDGTLKLGKTEIMRER